ncbi:MAG: glycosyltransferase, partial [Chloroflexi bacterium]|nr:glycosyltransferase [Chloroflexota bacterium]
WSDPLYGSDVHPGAPWDLLKEVWPGVQYVVVSEERRRELERLWGKRGEIAVVPPGIDPYAFLGLSERGAGLARDLMLLDAAPLLLLPARITRRKNVERAIEIMAALKRRETSARLLVTGPPGPHNPSNAAYLEQLVELRKSLGVDNDVVFLHEFGRVEDVVLRDLYRLADALLFPSQREGFGIPLLEAALVRLPIFCADLGPFRETALDYANYFQAGESAERIAARMADWFAGDATYQLKRRVISDYGWERIFADKIEPLLRA